MAKYLEVVKIGWKENISYRFDVISNAFFSIFRVILVYILWKTIFASRTEVAGFTFEMMITYYIVISYLSKLEKSQQISKMLAYEVRGGQFTKYLTKPLFHLGYYFSLVLAKASYVGLFNTAAVVVWVLIFRNIFIFPQNIALLGWAVLIFLMGLIFMALLNYFFIILSFWIVEVNAFFMIKDNLFEFLTGAIIPLNLLPLGVVGVLKFLPFYYIYYFPTALFLNQRVTEIPAAICTLVIWISLMLIVDIGLYRVAIKSYDGVGI